MMLMLDMSCTRPQSACPGLSASQRGDWQVNAQLPCVCADTKRGPHGWAQHLGIGSGGNNADKYGNTYTPRCTFFMKP